MAIAVDNLANAQELTLAQEEADAEKEVKKIYWSLKKYILNSLYAFCTPFIQC